MRFKKAKKILLPFAASAIIILIVLLAAFYINLCAKDEISKKILFKKPLKCAVLLYGSQTLYPERLESFLIYYERKNSIVKIISVNTDAVFFDKRKIARSLKKTFFEAAKKDIKTAVEKFYLNLFSIVDDSFEPDFYISADYETFLKTFEGYPKIKSLVSQTDFTNRDLQCLTQLEIAENIVKLLNGSAFSNIIKLKQYRPNQDEVLTKFAAGNLILHFKFNKVKIMFCDLPVKYGKKRIEPDRENIKNFFSQVYYKPTDIYLQNGAQKIEVKNASGRPRMAEKAAWLLRDEKFDVLEWSNFSFIYEKTIIKESKGNFGAALKMAKILKGGKIIISYDFQSFYEASVFIGKDCEIYDKLDRKKL
ncbi:MAG: LytR C-terminal domain-containing protein [Endomicrobium sp.]|jgi:hypothetical protein|nr:LytR C-terminal domain-containing protein [Endomicrobium sp.]